MTNLEKKRFTRILRTLKDDLQTYSNMPMSYALEDLQMMITRGPHTRKEKLAALDRVTAESTKRSMKDVLCSRPLQLTALAMGNLAESDAQNMISTFTTLLKEA